MTKVPLARVFGLMIAISISLGATGCLGKDPIANDGEVRAADNRPPVANAGPDQSGTVGQTFTFDGGASTDPDNNIRSYRWYFGDGTTATGVRVTHAFASAGTFGVTLTVEDRRNATSTDSATVTVNSNTPPPNQAPTASAGADRTITLPTNSVALSGTATDSDGTIASCSWTKLSGPSATLSGACTPGNMTANASALVQGSYIFRLTVTDDDGASDTDDMSVTVNAAPVNNIAPTANAGTDRNTQTLSSVLFSGSGSSDSDGTIVNYTWAWGDGTANSSGVSASHSFASSGSYTVVLTVTDDDGATNSDTAVVTVTNRAPSANAGSDKTVTLPTNTTTLSGSGTDADGTISSYAWTKVSGPTVSVTGSSTATLSLSNLLQGSYVIRLTVTDNKGATAFDEATVTVNAAPNVAPTANAGADKTITLPINSTTLSGSGTDSDGTISTYAWTKLSGPTVTTSGSSTATLSLSNLVQGNYAFRLTVTDNSGATGFDDVNVTVNAAANVPPSANAGSDRSTIVGNALSFSGSGSSDPDGSISSYSWNWGDGSTNSSGVSTSHTYNSVGTFTVTLTVTDNQSSTASDTATVVVSPASSSGPLNPVINYYLPTPPATGPIQALSEPNDVVIQGSTMYVASLDWGLAIYSLSNPARPTLLGVSDKRFTGAYLDVKNNRAVVAGWDVDGKGVIHIVDVSNLSAPRLLKSLNTNKQIYSEELRSGKPWMSPLRMQVAINADATKALVVDGMYDMWRVDVASQALLGKYEQGSELYYGCAFHPSNPSIAYFSTNLLTVGAINLSNLSAPPVVFTSSILRAWPLRVSGQYIYAASTSNIVQKILIDAANPTTLIGTSSTARIGGFLHSFSVQGTKITALVDRYLNNYSNLYVEEYDFSGSAIAPLTDERFLESFIGGFLGSAYSYGNYDYVLDNWRGNGDSSGIVGRSIRIYTGDDGNANVLLTLREDLYAEASVASTGNLSFVVGRDHSALGKNVIKVFNTSGTRPTLLSSFTMTTAFETTADRRVLEVDAIRKLLFVWLGSSIDIYAYDETTGVLTRKSTYSTGGAVIHQMKVLPGKDILLVPTTAGVQLVSYGPAYGSADPTRPTKVKQMGTSVIRGLLIKGTQVLFTQVGATSCYLYNLSDPINPPAPATIAGCTGYMDQVSPTLALSKIQVVTSSGAYTHSTMIVHDISDFANIREIGRINFMPATNTRGSSMSHVNTSSYASGYILFPETSHQLGRKWLDYIDVRDTSNLRVGRIEVTGSAFDTVGVNDRVFVADSGGTVSILQLVP